MILFGAVSAKPLFAVLGQLIGRTECSASLKAGVGMCVEGTTKRSVALDSVRNSLIGLVVSTYLVI